MAREFSYGFYHSMKWLLCRSAFLANKHHTCERCGGLGWIVHHKEPITPENVNDPNVTLNWDNLQVLCLDCHNAIHHGSNSCIEGLYFDEEGNLIDTPPGM